MKQCTEKKWRSSLVNEIIKEHPGAIVLFDSFKNIHCKDAPITVEEFSVKYSVPLAEIEAELNELLSVSYVESIGAEEWELDFLVDFLLNIHHSYLRKNIPLISKKIIDSIATNDSEANPSIKVILQLFKRAEKELLPLLTQTENSIFPYIKQIVRAHRTKESYGELLVSTLRKPIQQHLTTEIGMMEEIIEGIRVQSNYYCFDPSKIEFRPISIQLKAFDFQLHKHMQLKKDVLLPRALLIESALYKLKF